jgi:hypothetical protein
VPKPPPDDAQELLHLLHQRGRAHLTVKARGAHLLIQDDGGESRARITRLAAHKYGLSLPTSSGRWEPLPFAGTLAEVASDLDEQFGFHLDPDPTG